MYNQNDLFDIKNDNVIYKMINPYNKIQYNKDGEKGAVLQKEQVPFFTFPSLSSYDFIGHGFSTRLGGFSEGEYSTMNLSYNRGDNPDTVTKNYEAICESIGFETKDVVFSDQVHDTKVVRVTKEECQGDNLTVRKLAGIDGLITNERNVVLCTSYADCVPLFFVDVKKKAIGLSHSGWKGTVGKIGAKTIEAMKREFGSNVEDIHCVVGPSICAACYEVSKDVTDQIKENFSDKVYEACVLEKENGKFQLDLWMLNQFILLEAGVKKEQIEVSNVCTCCNHTLLFSHRASGGKRGNLCGFLSLI